MSFDFDDIRPYRDDEVESVLQGLIRDPEFLDAIAHMRLPLLHRWLPALSRSMVRYKFQSLLAHIHRVADFQEQVETYLDANLERTSVSLTTSGVDHLDPQRSYLFISNHRDIVMDPALCNLVLHRAGRDTFRIAIGDNLLSKPFAERLMRINKSFLVRRQASTRRQKFFELQKLSAYIRQSIQSDRQSVWIAQREGRAKDGLDRTDPALLKMLALSGPEGSSFAERIRDLHLVPVVVSYEWDPCDQMKAHELACKRRDGHYQKAEFEDIESIARGIRGQKGRIHVAFGDEIDSPAADADAMAELIDRQIIALYRLHPSNLAACQITGRGLPDGLAADAAMLQAAADQLRERASSLPQDEQQILLQTYANPVHSWTELQQRLVQMEPV